MAPAKDTYFGATRHPWPCLLFLAPMLVAYEAGVVYLGGADPEALRTGSDAWLRWTLQACGLRSLFWLPGLLAVVLLAWNWRRWRDRPGDSAGAWLGMAVESVSFALVLWGIGRVQEPLLEEIGMAVPAALTAPPGLTAAVSYLGAGIYEEFLFRLLLVPVLVWAFTVTLVPRPAAVALAMLLSSAVFAAAHHVGPYGEAYDAHTFLFRFLAGLYFAAVFQFRGFGVAVGAHACYDVLVGVALV
jgi:hypothetical protein